MQHAIGAESISDDVASYAIDGVRPKVVVFPESIEQLSRVMAAAWEANLAVAPWGGGTRIAVGNPIRRLDVVLDLSRLNRAVQLNPDDLTATVEAGMPVASLQQALAEHGQFLAIDPPLPDRATIGGTLASGTSGPLKWQYGHPRDLVIGMKVVQADGRVTRSGGQVVKNVSGYDMARLHVGGLGTLGVIAEVSFKLTPLPRGQATLIASFDSSQNCLGAALAIFKSHVVPLALTGFNGEVARRAEMTSPGHPLAGGKTGGYYTLAVRLGGRPLTLERQLRECVALCREGGAVSVETLDDSVASSIWRKLADFGWDQATGPLISCRASLLPARVPELVAALEQNTVVKPAIIAHPGYGTVLVYWYDEGEDAERDGGVLAYAQAAIHKADGRMIVERCPLELKAHIDVWDDVGEPLTIMRRMKEQYDARSILNPGRFAGGI